MNSTSWLTCTSRQKLTELADAFLVLPRRPALSTELFEAITWRQLRFHPSRSCSGTWTGTTTSFGRFFRTGAFRVHAGSDVRGLTIGDDTGVMLPLPGSGTPRASGSPRCRTRRTPKNQLSLLSSSVPRCGVADVDHVLPERAGRFAEDDLVAGDVALGRASQRSVVLLVVSATMIRVAGRSVRREVRDGHRVELGDVGDIAGVHEFGQIAELPALFGADVLMLVVVVLVDLGHTDGGEAGLVECGVVAPAEAVRAEDEHGFDG